MLVERPHKPSSLKDLSETAPTTEEVRSLRTAFERLLQEKGRVVKVDEGFLADIVLAPWGGNRLISYSTEVQIEGKGIDVYVFRRKNRNSSEEPLIVDIGMMTERGERVRLDFEPDDRVCWNYLDRSVLGQGFAGESPTKRDLELHKEVLELIRLTPPNPPPIIT